MGWTMPLTERPLPPKEVGAESFTRNIFHSGNGPHTVYLDGFSTNAPMDHIFRCKGATCGFTSISGCSSKWTRGEEPCRLCDQPAGLKSSLKMVTLRSNRFMETLGV